VDSILPVAGANEAIQLLAIAYGTNSFVFTPTYIEYIVVTSLKGKMTEIASIQGDEFSISPEKLPDSTLVFLANPNNPFGYTSREVIVELVKNNPDAIVVIDEAYAEFADLSVIDLVSKYPNLVILRSFSKSYALASARIGYLVGAPDVVKVVKEKAPWSNVSRLAAGAALSALDHAEYYAKMRERLNNGRDELEGFLQKEGFDVFPSKINAATVKFESAEKACDFVLHLAENNIEVNQGNGVANMGLDDSFVRIAIWYGGADD